MKDGNKAKIDFDRYAFADQEKSGLESISDSYKIKNNESDTDYFYEAVSSFEQLSVAENGGFYIGRFETGTTSVRTEPSESTPVVIKKGANVYNWVTKDEATTLAEGFANNGNVRSKLCSSYAWDTALKFIQQSGNETYLTTTSMGDTLENTGTETVNNIWDLTRNAYEWTSEISSNEANNVAVRGGAYSTQDSAITRIAMENKKYANVGFRIALFLTIN